MTQSPFLTNCNTLLNFNRMFHIISVSIESALPNRFFAQINLDLTSEVHKYSHHQQNPYQVDILMEEFADDIALHERIFAQVLGVEENEKFAVELTIYAGKLLNVLPPGWNLSLIHI